MSRIPTTDEILTRISDTPTKTAIAKAFGIKGADQIDLNTGARTLKTNGLARRKTPTVTQKNACG
ncbi:MAG: hypothetical protein AAFW64_04785 [Pseudomonadota bacterium]